MTKTTTPTAGELAFRCDLTWPCPDQRCTGRTTAIIVRALEYAAKGKTIRFCAPTHRMGEWITNKARQLAEKASVDTALIVKWTSPQSSRSFANDGVAVFHDHTCCDVPHV